MSRRLLAVPIALGLVLPVAVTGTAGPAQAAPAVRILRVYYNPAGSDTRTNAHLNQEYVLLKNVSSTDRALTSWTLRDAANHVYTFPATTLRPGQQLVVHTGRGTNYGAHRFWNSGNYIWNNVGAEKATLRTSTGAVVHTCSYTGRDVGTAAAWRTCP